jgi:mitogen-activated protein kinase 15
VHHRFIIYQILRALKYLHSANLIHRDLKPSNVLINSECEGSPYNKVVKLCDFGLVRSLMPMQQEQEVVLSEEVATRWYRSPEILLGSQGYAKPVDMWSVGCIVVEMLTGQPFFPGILGGDLGNSTLDQLERILTFTGRPTKEDIESLESTLAEQLIAQIPTTLKKQTPNIPPEFLGLVEGLIQFNPNKRITV